MDWKLDRSITVDCRVSQEMRSSICRHTPNENGMIERLSEDYLLYTMLTHGPKVLCWPDGHLHTLPVLPTSLNLPNCSAWPNPNGLE